MTELREKHIGSGVSPEGLAYEIAFWGKGQKQQFANGELD